MLLQILKHIPTWVFGLFFLLIYAGYLQSKTRLVSRHRLAILPMAMLGLSFFSVWSSFGPDIVALSAWAGALLIVVLSSLALPQPQGVSYSSELRLFTVPGSWAPLVLMMCIFFTKFAIAIAHPFNPNSANPIALTATVCAIYGTYSGLFLARALRIARTSRQS